jgi:Rrf2 family protein
VARVEHLPLAYLEQLAGALRRGGLIEATRGAHGGYVLSRRPELITVLDVITLVEGEVAPVECVAHDYAAGCCVRETDCASRTLWQRLKESVDAVLSGTTLADLVCDRPPVTMFIPLEDVRGTSPSPTVHEAAHV